MLKWLVVHLPLWKIWVRQCVNWDHEIPNWMESHKNHVPNHQPGDIMGDINEIFTGSFYIPSVDGITHNLSLNSDAMAEVLITTPPKKKYIHSFPRHGGWKPLGNQQHQPNARNPRYFFLKVCFWSSDISDLWLAMVFHAGKRRNCQVCPWANSSWNPRICEFPMGFSPWVFRHVFSSGKLPAGSTGIQHFYAVRVI